MELSAGWKVEDGLARTAKKGERIKVRFTGNRIDLLARSIKDGGKVQVGRVMKHASVSAATHRSI